MPKPWINILKHRQNANYGKSTFLLRFLYLVAIPFLRFSPKPFYGFRNTVLRIFGAQIGAAVRIYPSTQIIFPWNFDASDYATIGPEVIVYSLGKIKVGAHTMISQGTHLCAGSHDYKKCNLPLTTPEISVGEGVWICAEAFIGPGVTIGANSVVAARSVVCRDVPAEKIVAGNPAKEIKKRPKPEDLDD